VSDPWFKRFGFIGYVPINRKGVIVLVVMLAVFIPFAALFLFLPEDAPVSRWVFATSAFAVVAVGHVLVLLHLETSGRK
jgi:hypothetical protein